MSIRPLSEIAAEIKADWANASEPAAGYIEAMQRLSSIHDNYGLDSGVEIVARFLGSAATWRGPTAQRVKAELNEMLDAR